MGFPGILVLAVGLAMDATAVAAARGLSAPRVLPRHVIAVALLFGGFQALMPLAGWLVGERFGESVAAWDHWIAWALLASLGAKLLVDAWRGAGEDEPVSGDPFALRVLVLLAVATSVDALAAGISLPLVDAPLGLSLVTIGVTTAVLSAAGLFAGRRFGALVGRRLDAIGGFALIGLGTKILVEHLAAG